MAARRFSTVLVHPARRVLSGVQPSGDVHLGNYLGAIKSWVALQEEYENYFCVVDLHAVTTPFDRTRVAAETLNTAALFLACGIDPEKSCVFVQSHVAAHSELAWLLNCSTPLAWLERMTQFREKQREGAAAASDGSGTDEGAGVGLLSYPTLMAADILLYGPHLVPVGADQRQHLELTRDIARRCNRIYRGPKGTPSLFRVPEALIPDAEGGARIMSLDDGTAKMSKSAPRDASRINLLDSPDLIARKIKRAKTDDMLGVTAIDEKTGASRPECANLLAIYAAARGDDVTPAAVAEECRAMSWGQFKPLLADALAAYLAPIQTEYALLREDEAHLRSVLRAGAARATAEANPTVARVRDAMGFLAP